MGLGIARGLIDYASTHSDHIEIIDTIYVPSAGSNVFVNGFPAVVQFDTAACGDIAIGCSTKVFIGGKGVHRLTDPLDSHMMTYPPSFCAAAATNVFAG